MAKWWLISWTTHGTWLPGDKRGYRTWRGHRYVPPPKRYAKREEPVYKAGEHAGVLQVAESISHGPTYLSHEQMEIALAAMVEEIDQISVAPAIMSVGDSHVHWLCYFGPVEIRPTVSRVKAAASRELNRRSSRETKTWTKGCNMRSKATQRECRIAYKYVRDHRDQECLIYEWKIDPQYLTLE